MSVEENSVPFRISLKHDVAEDYRKLFSEVPVKNVNLLLTEREGRTGEYWPSVVALRTERSEVSANSTRCQYSPVRLEQGRLIKNKFF